MNVTSPLAVALSGLTTTLALMLLAWGISVLRRNVAIVDVFWGIAIAGAGLTWASAVEPLSERGALVATLATLWAVRLAAHIWWRSRGKPEDRRYQVIRSRNEPNFAFKSLYLVFGLQAVLAWIVAMPLLGGVLSSAPVGQLDRLGTLIFSVGFVVEVIADWQMWRFQRQGGAERRVMDQGLWRFSRHPNYFGEFCLWWGIGLISVAGGAWWSAIGPLVLSFFLLKVSGVALTEKDIAERRPEYRDYIRRTSAFIPLPPRA